MHYRPTNRAHWYAGCKTSWSNRRSIMPATRENRIREPQPASAATTHVSTIMSRDVITVRSGTSVDVVAEVMLSRGLSRVPVLDASGHLIGLVSKTDLVEQAHDVGDMVHEAS